ncbi:PAP2 superfamily protein [Aphelenchoides avenae]|nr:PAP2 superfamily protein [Aphelenchus avenae]
MAYFGSEELIDCIRNGFAVEDDTGVCMRVLPMAQRRPKPGGLPMTEDGSDSEEKHSPGYVANVDETPPAPTSGTIRAMLLSKATAMQEVRIVQLSDQRPSSSGQVFAEELLRPREVSTDLPTTSAMARLLAELPDEEMVSQFDEYAKFEALEGAPNAKVFDVVFPFADRLPGDSGPFVLSIRVLSSAKISDLIGLSCYAYTRSRRTPPCSDPRDYSLYFAEENYEYDTELPPQDRHRSVADCGFPILALVPNPARDEDKPRHVVTVHTVTGRRYRYELDTLDVSLQWLLDESLKQYWEDEPPLTSPHVIPLREYVLEALDKEGAPLKLTNSISSSGTLDFVLLRKNSARGDFFNPTPGDAMRTSASSIYLSQPPMAGGRISPRSQEPLPPRPPSHDGTCPRDKRDSTASQTEEYIVERLHRIKPKWTARLLIHSDCVEIMPVHMDKRRSFTIQAAQKCTVIPWDFIGAVELADRAGSKKVLKIIWIPINTDMRPLLSKQNSDPTTRQSISFGSFADALNDDASYVGGRTQGNSSSNRRHVFQAFENTSWKTLLLEAADDEAWKIGTRLNEVIESRKSHVRTVYQHSSGGSRRPSVAATAAFGGGLKRDESTTSFGSAAAMTLPGTPVTPTGKFRRKLPMNPMPLFTRMLSRQD